MKVATQKVGVVYLYLSNAFDKVPQSDLQYFKAKISKCYSYNAQKGKSLHLVISNVQGSYCVGSVQNETTEH